MSDEEDEKIIPSYFPEETEEIVARIGYEGLMSKSEFVRKSIEGFISGEGRDVLDESVSNRLDNIRYINREVDDQVVRDFFWDTTYLIGEMSNTANKHSEYDWIGTAQNYFDRYFDELSVVENYQELSEDQALEFLDGTLEMIGSMNEIILEANNEQWYEEVDGYLQKYLETEEIPDKLGL